MYIQHQMAEEEDIPFAIQKIDSRLDENMITLAVYHPCNVYIFELLLILLVHRFQICTC